MQLRAGAHLQASSGFGHHNKATSHVHNREKSDKKRDDNQQRSSREAVISTVAPRLGNSARPAFASRRLLFYTRVGSELNPIGPFTPSRRLSAVQF
jgi:hypothetical protein